MSANAGSTGAPDTWPETLTRPTRSEPERLLLADLLDRQPLLAALNLAPAAVTTLMLADFAAPGPVLAWAGFVLAVQVGRVLVWLGLRRRGAGVAGPHLGAFLTGIAAASGLGWGTAGMLFGGGSGPQSTLIPFMLAGMSAGAVTALPGHPAAFFTFITLTLVPYACRLAVQPDTLSHALAAVTLVYCAGLAAVGYQVHRTLRRAATVHLDNAALVERLDHARQELEAKVTHRTTELRAANEALSNEVVERRRSEERVRHLLAHDPLTNLPNRLLLFDRLEQALARSRRFGTRTAVMIFDIDHFKIVNDTFGHPAGDRLLRELAHRVRAVIRSTDTAARIGGDEFALVAPDLGDAGQVFALADRLLAACREPIDLGDAAQPISISIGAATYPEHGDEGDALVRAADTALYDVKAGGRGRFALYSQELHDALQKRRRLESELVKAPERGQLRLAYQPRFALPERRLVAVEALLRWDHAEFGDLPTSQLIDVAETSGSMRALGRWVLDAACSQSQRWADAGHALPVAVNLSPIELRQPDLAGQIRRCLEDARLDPRLLEIEVTESACATHEGKAVESGLAAIKQLGVRLAIDDFGTGCSGLAYLKWLPFDVLKVDRSFVRNLAGDSRDAAIVATIITLARELDKTAVAEGVESPQQLDALSRLGCHQAQGFLLGRPATAEQIDALLAA